MVSTGMAGNGDGDATIRPLKMSAGCHARPYCSYSSLVQMDDKRPADRHLPDFANLNELGRQLPQAIAH